jgi:hypothetical protein
MKQISQTPDVEQPVGIVISRGSREQILPRVSAYIWCQVPEEAEAAASRAA